MSTFRLVRASSGRKDCRLLNIREENDNAKWCTITREVLVGTPEGYLLAYNKS